MEKERITTDQTSGEERGGLSIPSNLMFINAIGISLLVLFLCIMVSGAIQDNKKEIADLKATVIKLHAQQHEINTGLTEGFRESVRVITNEIDANQERDSLQTKAIDLLTKLSKR